MRSLVVLACIITIHHCSQAQYLPDSLVMPKTLNTVGTNVTPLGILLMNGIPVKPRFSLIYKRQVDVNKKLRIWTNYQVDERSFDERSDAPVDYSDSTITFLDESRDDFSYDLRAGMEFFKPNRVTTMVYGFDAVVGVAETYYESNTRPFYEDPVLEAIVPSPFKLSEQSSSEIDYFYFGADFSVGQKLNSGENFNFILQWTPTLLYRIPIREVYSSDELRLESPDQGLLFDLRGIELMVHYIF